MQTQCLVNSKETQSFPLGVRGEEGTTPSPQSKIKRGHFWQEAGYNVGCIVFGKHGTENNLNSIAVFSWS